MSGLLSSIERVLLAAVHFRHGPLIYLLHGVILFVGDGLKLYSKYAIEVVSGIGIFLFATLCCAVTFALCSIGVDFGILSWLCREFEIIFALL